MSTACPRFIAGALIGLFLSGLSQAAVLHVPADYIGIQRAIDASTNGDIVVVSPGMYKENINFRGKAVTVTSTNPSDPGVVSNTVIHAAGLRSVVTFANGENSGAVLTGFTITGGFGTANAAFATTVYWGGGIYCYRSAPTITGNIITANAGPDGTKNVYGYGSGIGCIEADPLITRNLIKGNTGYFGGGIMTYSGNPTIANNIICSNSAVLGGGVAMMTGGQLINNTLVGNSAQVAGNVYVSSDGTAQSVLMDNLICNASSGGGIYAGDNFTQILFNDIWNNAEEDNEDGIPRTGINGNFSADPAFVDASNEDFRLRDISPCINAGDPNFQKADGETDFYGNARIYAHRVDVGAGEYFDNFRPVADAGSDRLAGVTHLPALITLDGTASSDPNGAAISFRWRQIGGPNGSFTDAGAVKPIFNVSELGTYTFELVVNNGRFDSFPDLLQVIVKNDVPTADAGDDQLYSDSAFVPSITLDGSRSFDPENAPLTFHWKQKSGWKVELSDPSAAKPTFPHSWPGVYVFDLVVNDGMQDSKPSTVAIVFGPSHAPIADAGLARYVATNNTSLDGTHSYAPDGYGTLRYQWQQISGPFVTMIGSNTSTPVLSGFTQRTTNQTCVFELIVSDGYASSSPGTVSVIIVKSFGANALKLTNPPFDRTKPTIVAFSGGNCTTGSGLSFGGVWEEKANWLTVDSYGPAYSKYADMLIVYLSSVAPDYHQTIQTMGWSTGNLPAMETAWYINGTYRDSRYAVNRVSLLDAVCSDLTFRVTPYNANPVDGEQCWVDNYISNDSNYSPASFLKGALNVVCIPPRDHSYPVTRYNSDSLEYGNGGLAAFGYLSVIGAGKNYQLNTASNKYYFAINSAASLSFFNPTLYPGKILSPVQLNGPADGDKLDPNGTVFSCETVENATGYQVLFGSDPKRVQDFSIVSDTANPPSQTLSKLPQQHVWWTVRAYDRFGSTIYADPRLINMPENREPVANAGPNQVVYAGIDGKATVTLAGANSTDADGDALGFVWAWAIGGNAYLSNGMSLTIDLPVGTHIVQLMVNDGQVNSLPAEVKITVVAPIECNVRITPSTVNLRGNGPRILARVRFPDGFNGNDADRDEPLLISPGDIQAVKQWTANDESNQSSLFAFFERDALAGVLENGLTELTVVGKLRSGRTFYGHDIVQIIGKGR